MSDIKWIKLSTQMFEDEKIKLIEKMPEADTILIIWIKLLSQAGKVNASGYIFLNEQIPYTDEMLATIFNRSIGTVRMALNVFQQFGMIEIDEENFISISNWEKHQNIEGLERVRKLNAERNKKYRERKKQKQIAPNVNSDASVTSHDGTEVEVDIDLEKEKDITTTDTREDNSKTGTGTPETVKKEVVPAEIAIIERYQQLRGILNASPKDLDAAKEIVQEGVPPDKAIQFLEEKFKEFEKHKKHNRDKINGLSYCVGYILDRFYEEKEGGKRATHRNGHAGSSKKGKSYADALRELEADERAWQSV
ncbi:phage replisome organizer N-terminal domain-containing protein [Radiobacillus kanasensis]|uniref:phage replisome organizer N-terminal domain-containing protein n=1 Tax=Radiobacillus kanasensis TaxID=2844358 RepID=UPI001E49110F|nr:phage replisome organizer N-terminal domain-containing protein [Radiobacillus kanasensis]UFU00343.1 phage replisome organizer N-terminal domain-containing protein [Radiobacillus kanasensis]